MIKSCFMVLSLVLAVGCGQHEGRDKTSARQTSPSAQSTPAATPIKQKPRPFEQTDDVYGIQIPKAESWRVESGKVYQLGKEVKLRGINWFGFESPNLVVHGLWTGRTIGSFVSQVKQLGFDAMRVPLSPEVFSAGARSSHGREYAMENLHELLRVTGEYKVNVLLDLHNCSYNSNLSGNPFSCKGKELWLDTLRKMATLSKGYPHVLGIDLFNEPYGLSWKEWRVHSSEAAKNILAINPRILIFVEGVANNGTDNAGYGAFWGENLVEAGAAVPEIPLSRLVFSPHVYGPSVAWQPYFGAADFPGNMSVIWERHFGYLIQKGFTLAVGEFGGRYVDKDRIWADSFIPYLNGKGMGNFFYWCLNPNSGDTGGILLDDWKSVNEDKMKLIRKLF